MNKIIKTENGYQLVTETGETFECSTWFEKKTNAWHIVVPKEAREICGRTYIREKYLENKDEYLFETKTEHREGMSYGGWKSRMTEEEKQQWLECEKLMETIKQNCMNRQPVELTETEKLEREIKKLQEKLAKAQAQA